MGANLSLLLSLLEIDCLLQGLGFAVSAPLKTEKFYDLFGTGTFLVLIIKGVHAAMGRQALGLSTRQIVNSSFVATWALRLGSFLFSRALSHGDKRFEKVKDNPKVFAMYWTIQAVWIFLTSLPVQLLLTVDSKEEVGVRDYIGWTMWATGFFLQVTADRQKSAFRAVTANKDAFIHTGLWAASQHPNYCGEILMWSGLWLSCSSVFSGALHLSALSPLLVYYLLRHVSGVPILAKQGAKRWGHLAEYQAYLKSTPVLFPSLSKLFGS
jgi:steroid 5-alpha reductase family enzyme